MEALMASMTRAAVPDNRVRLVVVDFMFTLLQPVKRRRQKMLCGVYRDPGNTGKPILPDNVNNRRIWRTILEQRRRFLAIKDDDEFWQVVNTFVYRELLELGTPRYRLAAHYSDLAHTRVLTDPALYRVDRQILGVVRYLKATGVKVVIGSNSRDEAVMRMLRSFGIDDEFECVYTSESLGVRKPFSEFWEKIAEIERVQIGEMAHLGNSAVSDTGLADIGSNVCLYDPNQELKKFLAGDVDKLPTSPERAREVLSMIVDGRVTVCRGPSCIRDWIQPHLATSAHS